MKSLIDAVKTFSDPDVAHGFIRDLRWPTGAVCPECKSIKHYYLAKRRIWKCRKCSKQFSVKVGTIFESSPIDLGTWLVALWLVANAKNGISSCELARSVGVTQKSAWHMINRIRQAMDSGSFLLEGEVEVDETYVGGKVRARGNRKGVKDKAVVFGALERGGDVQAYSLPDDKPDTLRGAVRSNVAPGATLYTDMHGAYQPLRFEYKHEAVSHDWEWARGEAHTNTIENFWCLYKRCIRGTWVRPSPKHLDRYTVDQVFRYNLRHTDDCGRFLALSSQVFGRRLTWRNLVGR